MDGPRIFEGWEVYIEVGCLVPFKYCFKLCLRIDHYFTSFQLSRSYGIVLYEMLTLGYIYQYTRQQ